MSQFLNQREIYPFATETAIPDYQTPPRPVKLENMFPGEDFKYPSALKTVPSVTGNNTGSGEGGKIEGWGG